MPPRIGLRETLGAAERETPARPAGLSSVISQRQRERRLQGCVLVDAVVLAKGKTQRKVGTFNTNAGSNRNRGKVF